MLLALLLLAAAPPEADGALAPWFHSLTVPDTGGECCGVADCRNLPVRADGERYWVLYDGEWVAVPDDAVLDRADNPTGDYIVCVQRDFWRNGVQRGPMVRCLVKPPRT